MSKKPGEPSPVSAKFIRLVFDVQIKTNKWFNNPGVFVLTFDLHVSVGTLTVKSLSSIKLLS